jgi:hypothetical protein
MLRHEHFEEVCAAASVGQATGEELVELEQHASECERCKQAYFNYLSVAAQQFATAKQDPTISPRAIEECIDSELFIRRFLDRAEREGITFSRDVEDTVKLPAAIPFAFSRKVGWQMPATAIAATLLFAAFGLTGYFYGRDSLNRSRSRPESQLGGVLETPAQVRAVDLRIAELADANLKLQAEVEHLRGELRDANDRLVVSQTDLKATSQDRRSLASNRDALELRLGEIQRELTNSQALVANAQQEAMSQHQRAADMESTLIAEQVKLHDLESGLKDKSAALDQERQLLSLGHDVTDLMGARNLHIVDVVDTDGRGKARPAFGRIFFTEGKSLIFYAYDLNEAKMQKANYQYQVWAKKEGPNRQAQRLGIFYSDDKAQRRWVFKCDDAKILREIDSVFVTFGRPDGDSSHPEGSSLMYAYLRGQPNHP